MNNMSKSRMEDQQKLRIFVAVPLPQEIRTELNSWREKNSSILPFKKWTHAEDFHITLQFLGDTNSEDLPSLCYTLQQISGTIEFFRLSLTSLGVFGLVERPRVLWAGLDGDLAALEKLQQRVVEATALHGFQKEDRPYRPHVTLARKYMGEKPLDQRLLDAKHKADMDAAWIGKSWEAREFVLYVTRMGRQPMYEVAESFPLGIR